uniref:Uncharacterized protein n=2 Tax=Canis lupus familiaris TaxID=9615 RepID=A0A8I3SCK2_CANLF
MEAGAAAEDGRDGPRERLRLGEAGRQPQNHEVRPQSAADRFPKHSYWLDLWLFILLDVVLFVFVMVCLMSRLRSWFLEWILRMTTNLLNKEDRIVQQNLKLRDFSFISFYSYYSFWGLY